MREANRAPFFACLYHGLCDIARDRGYALAIHGSVVTDLDIIACPWTTAAVSPIELRDALMDHIGACGYSDLLRRDCSHLTEEQIRILTEQQEGTSERGSVRPHGRITWNLYLTAGSKVDLSVMPRLLPQEHSDDHADAPE